MLYLKESIINDFFIKILKLSVSVILSVSYSHMENMLNRLNAVTFPTLCEVETLRMTGSSSETVRKAAIQCIERGFMSGENEEMHMRDEVSSGQSAMILCRFLASMTNLSQ